MPALYNDQPPPYESLQNNSIDGLPTYNEAMQTIPIPDLARHDNIDFRDSESLSSQDNYMPDIILSNYLKNIYLLLSIMQFIFTVTILARYYTFYTLCLTSFIMSILAITMTFADLRKIIMIANENLQKTKLKVLIYMLLIKIGIFISSIIYCNQLFVRTMKA